MFDDTTTRVAASWAFANGEAAGNGTRHCGRRRPRGSNPNSLPHPRAWSRFDRSRSTGSSIKPGVPYHPGAGRSGGAGPRTRHPGAAVGAADARASAGRLTLPLAGQFSRERGSHTKLPPHASPLPANLISALDDRYRIDRELGEGGMATVYLAEDLKHHRPVAIKVLKPELAASIGGDASSPRSKSPPPSTTPTSCRCTIPAQGTGPALYTSCPTWTARSLRDRLEPREAASRSTRPYGSPGRWPTPCIRARTRRGPPGHQAGEHPARAAGIRPGRISGLRGRSPPRSDTEKLTQVGLAVGTPTT